VGRFKFRINVQNAAAAYNLITGDPKLSEVCYSRYVGSPVIRLQAEAHCAR